MRSTPHDTFEFVGSAWFCGWFFAQRVLKLWSSNYSLVMLIGSYGYEFLGILHKNVCRLLGQNVLFSLQCDRYFNPWCIMIEKNSWPFSSKYVVQNVCPQECPVMARACLLFVFKVSWDGSPRNIPLKPTYGLFFHFLLLNDKWHPSLSGIVGNSYMNAWKHIFAWSAIAEFLPIFWSFLIICGVGKKHPGQKMKKRRACLLSFEQTLHVNNIQLKKIWCMVGFCSRPMLANSDQLPCKALLQFCGATQLGSIGPKIIKMFDYHWLDGACDRSDFMTIRSEKNGSKLMTFIQPMNLLPGSGPKNHVIPKL